SLDQLSGAIYASTATANLQHTTFYLSRLTGRLRGRMTPGDPLSSSGFAEAAPESEVVLVAYHPAEKGACDACSSCSTRRAWLAGSGLGGTAQSDGNADGFSYGLGGTQFALEKAISRNWAIGA